jgi:hypothetical protein
MTGHRISAAIFRLRPLTPIGSPSSLSQASVWEYKQHKFCAESYLIALMVEMELVSETSDFMKHLARLCLRKFYLVLSP